MYIIEYYTYLIKELECVLSSNFYAIEAAKSNLSYLIRTRMDNDNKSLFDAETHMNEVFYPSVVMSAVMGLNVQIMNYENFIKSENRKVGLKELLAFIE